MFRVEAGHAGSESSLCVLPAPLGRGSVGVDEELPVDGVGDPPFEGSKRLFLALPLVELALVVSAGGGVAADLADGDHVDRTVKLSVAAVVEPVSFPRSGGRLDGAVPL